VKRAFVHQLKVLLGVIALVADYGQVVTGGKDIVEPFDQFPDEPVKFHRV
jgi:hypothetical protein